MKTRYSPLKLRTAAARSFNTGHRAVLAMAFILALVVAPTLIPPNGSLTVLAFGARACSCMHRRSQGRRRSVANAIKANIGC